MTILLFRKRTTEAHNIRQYVFHITSFSQNVRYVKGLTVLSNPKVHQRGPPSVSISSSLTVGRTCRARLCSRDGWAPCGKGLRRQRSPFRRYIGNSAARKYLIKLDLTLGVMW